MAYLLKNNHRSSSALFFSPPRSHEGRDVRGRQKGSFKSISIHAPWGLFPSRQIKSLLFVIFPLWDRSFSLLIDKPKYVSVLIEVHGPESVIIAYFPPDLLSDFEMPSSWFPFQVLFRCFLLGLWYGFRIAFENIIQLIKDEIKCDLERNDCCLGGIDVF